MKKDSEINNIYPLWLVPIHLCKELKKIGFDKYTQNIHYESGTEENGYKRVFGSKYVVEDDKNSCYNEYEGYTAVPTYLQVIDWFRKKYYRTKIDDGGTWIHWSFYNESIEPEISEKEPIDGYETSLFEAYEKLVKAMIKVEKEQKIRLKLKENGNT